MNVERARRDDLFREFAQRVAFAAPSTPISNDIVNQAEKAEFEAEK